MRAPFRGNNATRHGSRSEKVALGVYQQASGHTVAHIGFRHLGDDPVHSWLAGSPDGLIQDGSVLTGRGATSRGACRSLCTFLLRALMQTRTDPSDVALPLLLS